MNSNIESHRPRIASLWLNFNLNLYVFKYHKHLEWRTRGYQTTDQSIRFHSCVQFDAIFVRFFAFTCCTFRCICLFVCRRLSSCGTKNEVSSGASACMDNVFEVCEIALWRKSRIIQHSTTRLPLTCVRRLCAPLFVDHSLENFVRFLRGEFKLS